MLEFTRASETLPSMVSKHARYPPRANCSNSLLPLRWFPSSDSLVSESLLMSIQTQSGSIRGTPWAENLEP